MPGSAPAILEEVDEGEVALSHPRPAADAAAVLLGAEAKGRLEGDIADGAGVRQASVGLPPTPFAVLGEAEGVALSDEDSDIGLAAVVHLGGEAERLGGGDRHGEDGDCQDGDSLHRSAPQVC